MVFWPFDRFCSFFKSWQSTPENSTSANLWEGCSPPSQHHPRHLQKELAIIKFTPARLPFDAIVGCLFLLRNSFSGNLSQSQFVRRNILWILSSCVPGNSAALRKWTIQIRNRPNSNHTCRRTTSFLYLPLVGSSRWPQLKKLDTKSDRLEIVQIFDQSYVWTNIWYLVAPNIKYFTHNF